MGQENSQSIYPLIQSTVYVWNEQKNKILFQCIFHTFYSNWSQPDILEQIQTALEKHIAVVTLLQNINSKTLDILTVFLGFCQRLKRRKERLSMGTQSITKGYI